EVSYLNNESRFRWDHLQDQMVFVKLREHIKKFADDGDALKDVLRETLLEV
ncbi:hypothetical protein F5J12DRAFT_722413, partial [Pisolithus orientalis]|uniref:uncharacterized protein n=1 Tax=Pisolithus orientalis TaxID=936130 RepID=UPI0022242832